MRFITNPSSAVVEEINKRKELSSRSNSLDPIDIINWNKKTPWIEVSSFAYNGKYSFGDNTWKLHGTWKTDFDETLATQYTLNNNYPHRPKRPFITGLEVENYGTLGSLKKAKISFKCFTLDQLEALELLYMTPSFNIEISYGWSVGETDSFIGCISNFNWSLEQNGEFSCWTEVISPGISLPSTSVNENRCVEDAKSKRKYKKTISKYIKDIKDQIKAEQAIKGKQTGWLGWDILAKDELYCTFKWFIDKINRFIEGTVGSDIPVNEGYENIGVYNTKEPIPVRYVEKLISCDYNKFVIISSDIDHTFDTKFEINSTVRTGDLRNVLLNPKGIKDSFKGAKTIKDGINNLCQMLNEYTVEYWDIEPIYDEKTQKNIFVDNKWAPEISNNVTPIDISIFGTDSIARDVTIESEITDEFKNMAIYSIHKKNKEDKTDEEDSTKNFWGDLKDKHWEDNKEEWNKEPSECPKAPLNAFNELKVVGVGGDKTAESTAKVLDKANWETKIEEEHWDNLREIYREKEKIVNSCYKYPRMFPLSLSVTLDGILGIEYGNVFIVNYIPERYRNKHVYWIITEIKHSIKRGGWTTSLTGMMTVRAT